MAGRSAVAAGLGVAVVLAVALSNPAVIAAQAAAAPPPQAAPAPAAHDTAVNFHFENPQAQLARYTIAVHPDGTGHFHSDASPTPPENPSDLPSQGLDRPIQVSAAVTQRIFAVARAKKLFAIKCEAGMKVAQTGRKQLSYTGPDGQGSCEYNYSRDPQIEWLTGEMQGIASTLEAGRRLELQHQHGRLDLDGELATLEEMVQNGQALELGNIAPILPMIVQDQSVLERAQRRARQLLQVAQAAHPAQPGQ